MTDTPQTLTLATSFAAPAGADNANDTITRRPQDHGPLSPAEITQRRAEMGVLRGMTDAYQGLCDRYGPARRF